MLPSESDINARILLNSQASRLLREASLGAKLVRSAHIAAAIHMAQSALTRSDVAQNLHRPEAAR